MRALLVIGVVLFLATGCMAPYGMNMQSEQKRSLEESRATQAVAETSTKAEGPAGVTVTQGEGSTATIAPPAPTKFEHTASKSTGEAHGVETQESADWVQKNPFTWVLLGAGLILIAIGIKKLWDLVKNTSIGKAALVADDAGKKIVDGLKKKMQSETDPTKIAALKDAIVEAEEQRDANYGATVAK